MSEIFTTVFEIVGKVRKGTESCAKKLEGFETRAEDAPTLLSQGLTQAVTFYLYKVENLENLRRVYCSLFDSEEGCKNVEKGNVCSSLDDEGYLLYTSTLFYLLRELKVDCEITELQNNLNMCIKEISENEAKIYRKLINYVIELKKVSKILISKA